MAKIDYTEIADKYQEAKAREEAAKKEADKYRAIILKGLEEGKVIQASDGRYANASPSIRYDFDVPAALAALKRHKLDISEFVTIRATEFRVALGEKLWKKIPHTAKPSMRLTFAKEQKKD